MTRSQRPHLLRFGQHEGAQQGRVGKTIDVGRGSVQGKSCCAHVDNIRDIGVVIAVFAMCASSEEYHGYGHDMRSCYRKGEHRSKGLVDAMARHTIALKVA
eukprot:4326133-Amphidinium_carterae.1